MELAHWRRLTAEMYAAVRASSGADPRAACHQFREARDRMFASHPQSPLDQRERGGFTGLRYFPFDPAWRFTVPLLSVDGGTLRTFELPEGVLSCRPFGRVEFEPPGNARVRLTLYWLEGYGGGLFLPFKDGTSGGETYGGGRYLYDTIKGADLGAGPRDVVLDFNYAYNPSCAYDSRWTCPLAPAENALPLRVEAGELEFLPPGRPRT